ncbi:peptidase C39 family protein [Streptomyces sp. NPDC059740]|uniref:peptidase C39 family protein n=1 Tax=Streptomyces sp. NPDC059740 TaxID=3346926 RepID=UPI003661DC53
MNPSTSRRAVLAAALAAAAGAAGPLATASAAPRPTRTTPRPARPEVPFVDHHTWNTPADWHSGTARGTATAGGPRSGVRLVRPLGATEYHDPHTGTTASWEYATWTSAERRLAVPATEVIASWNADTPAGTWIAVEFRGVYSDRSLTPWYVMGRWTAGDADGDIRRTSVDGQSDGRSKVWTDTFSVDDPASGLRVTAYQLRLTLYRRPGTSLSPTVWRLGAMGSAVPDRFEVPASTPGLAAGRELAVPRYSQELHKGQYPQYDNGGEAWCSPTSSEMVVEYWGHRPDKEALAWVDPAIVDPAVCVAARGTFDYQYEGCGNWPFNAAYAATYPGLQSTVTRLGSLNDVERLVHAGIPVITSQSFLASELDGANYGTSGHLMVVAGFTPEGDVVTNDPASADDPAVRNVYKRHQFETIWLRTKRKDANGQVKSGSGGVCYLYWPVNATAVQRRALASVGVR